MGGDHDAGELHEYTVNLASEVKQELVGNVAYDRAKASLKKLKTFQDRVIKELKKEAKQKTAESTAKGKFVVDSVEESFCDVIRSYLEKKDPLFDTGFNHGVKWVVQNDLLHSELPSAVAFPAGRGLPVVNKILAMTYYRTQKAWVEKAMAKSKVERSNAIIVKPTSLKQVTAAIADNIGPDVGR